jgi:hypothetical protein
VKPEHDERFRPIADDYLDRPGGDFAELLARGEVSSPDGADPELRRAEIRSKARADKIRVMTIRSGGRAIAVRRLSIPKDQELAVSSAAMQLGELLRGVAERARQLGHEIVRWVAPNQESIAMCPAATPGLFDALPPVTDGEALDHVCPG